MIDFKTRIKDLCKEKGVTQQELAEKMGMQYTQLNAILRGIDPNDKVTKTYPSIKTLMRIAEALGIEVEDIFVTDEVLSRHKGANADGFVCPHCGKEVTITLGASIGNDEKS